MPSPCVFSVDGTDILALAQSYTPGAGNVW